MSLHRRSTHCPAPLSSSRKGMGESRRRRNITSNTYINVRQAAQCVHQHYAIESERGPIMYCELSMSS